MAKRLKKGKGIRVRYFDEEGEIVRSYIHFRKNVREYEIRLGPARFIYLERKEFEVVDTIIKFDTLVKLRQTEGYW